MKRETKNIKIAKQKDIIQGAKAKIKKAKQEIKETKKEGEVYGDPIAFIDNW